MIDSLPVVTEPWSSSPWLPLRCIWAWLNMCCAMRSCCARVTLDKNKNYNLVTMNVLIGAVPKLFTKLSTKQTYHSYYLNEGLTLETSVYSTSPKAFHIRKNLEQEAQNFKKKKKIFPYMEHVRIVVHFEYWIFVSFNGFSKSIINWIME